MKKTSFPDSPTQVASAKEKPTNGPAAISKLLLDCCEEIAVHPITEIRAQRITEGIMEVAIDPHPGDVKRLIGTNGAHINALRRFAKLWGDANDASVTIPDFDAPKDNHDRYDEFSPEAEWPKDRLLGKLQAMVESVALAPVQVQAVDSDAQTHVVFRYGRDVDGRLMTALAGPLAILGNAMGKKNGRTLAVHIRSESLVRNGARR